MSRPLEEAKLCPFCTCVDDLEIVWTLDDTECHVACMNCGAKGPDTRVGCREPEEVAGTETEPDAQALRDCLEREAIELWNCRCFCDPAERTGGGHDPKCPHYEKEPAGG
jgi:hypothetical protein